MCVLFPGRPIPDHPPVPLHRLAGAGGAQVRGRLHRVHWTSAQDQRAVRPGRTNHGALQVRHPQHLGQKFLVLGRIFLFLFFVQDGTRWISHNEIKINAIVNKAGNL